ncbi:hypothetical protein [Lyngbya sp. CCY1209]|uniref:hypothetical protein n=1 Tax=Lyngbya sp. CCY1209 TaxID=2886103 RepID=UPI002D215D68|nr:hypothetical protein [Lyngbya sp. CCY1209]MEB3884421.1 hypothetical protein [Lyngbya sp. CCY1209]
MAILSQAFESTIGSDRGGFQRKVQRLDGSYPNVKSRVKGESNSRSDRAESGDRGGESCGRMKIR